MPTLLPWALLIAYGTVFYLIAPRSRDTEGTNAANLGATYGLPGAVAYGTYWLSIPVAAVVIVWLRSRDGATSLPEWIAQRYGRWAAYGFLVAILVRLYNEVWSNTAGGRQLLRRQRDVLCTTRARWPSPA